jgi:hypothetical protein
MLKLFQDLTIGDRALTTHNTPQWVVVTAPPEPIDDSNPTGLWEVYTKGGSWLELPLVEVFVHV